MRKTIFFLLLLLSTLSALPLHAQNDDVRLSMSFRNESLSGVLLRLEKNSSYKFLFTYDDLEKYKVNGQVKNALFMDIVDYILKDKPLEYKVNGKFINITVRHKANQNDRKMESYGGYVYDEKGEPITGAQIKVLGTKVIAVTDIDGAYSFDYLLVGKHQIQVSYIGMKTVTLPLQRHMKIKMKEESQQLEGVVVTGIFRKARESYTGSVSSVTSEQLSQYRGTNLLQTLKNIDASINFSIDNLNGSNPNNLPNINIRGNSSLPMSVEEFNQGTKSNPNTPLVIMDGFEISLQKLMDYNDEEIESINILKDAAATAIYGSKGANGVIVVVSKQPEPGSLRVNVEAGLQMEIPDLSSYHLLNAADKLELERRAGLYYREYNISTNSNQFDILYKEAYNKRLRAVLSGVSTDWLSKPLHIGVGQRYNVRVEGGSNEFRWAADVQYNDVEGAMKGSYRKNFNGSVTLLYKYKTLTFRNYTSVGINNSKESPYGSFSNYAKQQPYNSPYDSDGRPVKLLDPFIGFGSGVENPLYNATLGSFDKSNYQELTNNFSVDWNILPEFTLRGQFGITKNDDESNFFRSPEDTYYSNSDTGTEYQSGNGFLRRGLFRYGSGKTLSYNADITLSYSKVFSEVHSLYVGINSAVQQQVFDGFNVAFEGFASDDLAKIANARQYAEKELPAGNNTKMRYFGLTGNVNYTYNGKYYIDFSYRVDGNSSYGSDKKYAPFWSTGIGWNLHNEDFLKGNKIVNMLRLKASYGETGAASGASENDAYTYYRYVTDNRYMAWMGAVLGGFGNSNLSWQTTREMNIGTEFGLLNNRIKGTFEVYTKNTNNLLSSMDMPLSMGFSSYRANIGEVQNRGWEASLQGYIIRDDAHKINWLVGAQIVYNTNKITRLSQAIKDQTEAYMSSDAYDEDGSGIQNLFYEGRPQNSIYAVRSLGIDPSTGREIYLDKNGNITDIWKATDKVYCGSAEPLYRGNLNTMLQWKDFTLNASFGYYWGGKMYNSTLRDRVELTLYDIRNQNVDERVLNERWYREGDVVFFKKLGSEQSKATSRYVMDNNVLELQSISLQYKLHNAWLEDNFKLQSAIFGVNMNDLIHWGSIRMERGTSYPYSRNIQFSIKLLF